MSDVVPAAMALLEPALKARLAIVQQARDEDVERVTRAYREAGVSAEIAPFFSDLPARMAAADFVIARGGASTVAELAVIGRPSILVPLPGALDQDQAANARALAAAGGTRVVMQTDFTPQSLAATLSATLADQAGLVAMAAAARATGRADAAERLADVVLDLIARKRR
jgi:UDP-N-acetylglucosamine--N-acetylmuramyl-(pentapeptide) pyrophosphoryl-undecaprenol N-acetylglucosamine transferase